MRSYMEPFGNLKPPCQSPDSLRVTQRAMRRTYPFTHTSESILIPAGPRVFGGGWVHAWQSR